MSEDITRWLVELGRQSDGANRDVLDKLMPVVYDERGRLAASFTNQEYAAVQVFRKVVYCQNTIKIYWWEGYV
jgi:hypothetical protein